MSDDVADEMIDINPWPVIDLIGRAACLATVARRGMLDINHEDDLFTRETDRFELASWARTELLAWITENELRLLDAPIVENRIDLVPECEEAMAQASAIAWALRAIPAAALPVPEESVIDQLMLDWLPQPWGHLQDVRNRARLRPDEELEAERERCELWEWRCNDESFEAEALPDVVRESAASGLIVVRQGDFVLADGRVASELTDDERHDITWLSQQRLTALNWVCGLFPSWEMSTWWLETVNMGDDQP